MEYETAFRVSIKSSGGTGVKQNRSDEISVYFDEPPEFILDLCGRKYRLGMSPKGNLLIMSHKTVRVVNGKIKSSNLLEVMK